jgi:hypothetical protein
VPDDYLRAERRPAPAGRLGIRVLDGEAATHVVVDEVDFRALQVSQADGIDKQFDALHFEHLVRFGVAFPFVNHQAVLESGAPATLHEHPQAGAHFRLLGQKFVDLLRRSLGHVDHALIIRDRPDPDVVPFSLCCGLPAAGTAARARRP